MKKKNHIKILVAFTFISILICLIGNITLAKGKINVTSTKQKIEKEEEIEIMVNIDDSSVASMTLQIYFDMSKLEYIPHTENANFSQNRVIYTWVNSNGESKENQTDPIEKFTFKGMQEGMSNIIVTGEFYDKNGNIIEIDDGNIEIQIDKQEQVQANNNSDNKEDNEEAENITSDNTNLKVLRLNEEGISPDFQTDIKEYYFVASNDITKLDIIAIPENKNAKVTITGNTNLKMGKNVIKIEVVSEDKTKKTAYTIYVTKTKNIESANSNLENLAVREAMLFPPFDRNITEYQIEVANNITKVDILAISENAKANVTINGNNDLKIGSNIININITAPDGITHKKYTIKAYRRNEQEEVKAKEEEKSQAEQLASILENEEIQKENQNNNQNNEQNDNQNSNEDKQKEQDRMNIVWSFIAVAVVISIAGVLTFIYLKRKK